MDSIPFASKVAVPQSVLVQELQGDTVFLNLDSECYLGLDQVGTSMWNALVNAPSVQDAFERLLEEYEVEPDRLRGDLGRLIEDLVAHGLITLND
jgi:Coenzyme PQQ synthesis protein D (PqqD)